MGLEAATFIQDLVVTNPSGGDQKAQGDDHIRLIKSVLKNTFPGATAALSFGGWSLKNPNFLSKSADYTQLAADDGKAIYFDCSANPRTYNLLAVATAKDGFSVFIAKDASANVLTIDPTGAETINGVSAVTLGPNGWGYLICSGGAWRFFGNGSVLGAAGATDRSLTLWDGTSGNKIKSGPALGSSGQVLTSNGAGVDPSFKNLPATPFIPTVHNYDSGGHVISAGLTFDLTHNLGGMPDCAFCYLQNGVGEAGYSSGDIVLIGPAGSDTNNNMGASVVMTSTIFRVRLGSNSSVFRVLAKDTGDRWAITASSWLFGIRAQRFS